MQCIFLIELGNGNISKVNYVITAFKTQNGIEQSDKLWSDHSLRMNWIENQFTKCWKDLRRFSAITSTRTKHITNSIPALYNNLWPTTVHPMCPSDVCALSLSLSAGAPLRRRTCPVWTLRWRESQDRQGKASRVSSLKSSAWRASFGVPLPSFAALRLHSKYLQMKKCWCIEMRSGSRTTPWHRIVIF